MVGSFENIFENVGIVDISLLLFLKFDGKVSLERTIDPCEFLTKQAICFCDLSANVEGKLHGMFRGNLPHRHDV